jgi:hypothetical protein
VLARERDKLGELRVNRRFAAEERENSRAHPLIPESHPPVGLRQGDDAFVPVIGIMRATLAGQIAGVGEVNLQILDGVHGMAAACLRCIPVHPQSHFTRVCAFFSLARAVTRVKERSSFQSRELARICRLKAQLSRRSPANLRFKS